MKVIVTCFLFLIVFTSVGQKTQVVDTIPSNVYQEIINKQFRLIVGENSTSNFGSFAGIDLSEANKVTFSPVFTIHKNNLLAFKFSGGYTNGFADIFNGTRLNSNFSFGADYHFIPTYKLRKKGLRKVEITYSLLERMEFKHKKQELVDDCKRDYLEINTDEARANAIEILEKQGVKLKKQLDSLKGILGELEKKETTGENNKAVHRIKGQIQLLEYDSTIVTRKLLDINNTKPELWNADALNERGRKFAKELEKYDEKNLTVYGFKIGWFSVGGSVNRDDFKLYDPSLAYSSRIVSEDFISAQFRFKYSFFSWAENSDDKKRTFYWSTGLTYNYRSNILDLSSVEMTRTTSLGSSGTEQLDKIKKFDVYTGEYKRFIDELAVNGELYWFFLPENTFAVHGFTNLRLVSIGKTTFDLGVGLLYPFKGKDKEKTIVNAELYASLTTAPEDGKVGFRFSFPINFNPKQE